MKEYGKDFAQDSKLQSSMRITQSHLPAELHNLLSQLTIVQGYGGIPASQNYFAFEHLSSVE